MVRTKYISACLSVLLLSAAIFTGCGSDGEEVSGKDYVAVEPIPDESSDDADPEEESTAESQDGGSEQNDAEEDTDSSDSQTADADYFKDNGIVCTADRSFTSSAAAFFVDSDKNIISDNVVFSFGDTKCSLEVGDCSVSEGDNGTSNIQVVINGSITTTVEENAEADGTGEFDFGVSFMDFYLADRYTGKILLGKSNTDSYEDSSQTVIDAGGRSFDLNITDSVKWQDIESTEWAEPSETGGYTALLTWPFTRTITINAPREYEGAVLVLPKTGITSGNIAGTDNTGSLILDAEYNGQVLDKDDFAFIDIKTLAE